MFCSPLMHILFSWDAARQGPISAIPSPNSNDPCILPGRETGHCFRPRSSHLKKKFFFEIHSIQTPYGFISFGCCLLCYMRWLPTSVYMRVPLSIIFITGGQGRKRKEKKEKETLSDPLARAKKNSIGPKVEGTPFHSVLGTLRSTAHQNPPYYLLKVQVHDLAASPPDSHLLIATREEEYHRKRKVKWKRIFSIWACFDLYTSFDSNPPLRSTHWYQYVTGHWCCWVQQKFHTLCFLEIRRKNEVSFLEFFSRSLKFSPTQNFATSVLHIIILTNYVYTYRKRENIILKLNQYNIKMCA